MSPHVLIEDPQSFEIEKFLLAYPFFNKEKTLSLIDPNTGSDDTVGYEIYSKLANIPEIGLTLQPTPSHKTPIGFVGVVETKTAEDQDENDPMRPQFPWEALLVLDVDPKSLPEGVDKAWVIQVKDQKNEAVYAEIAEVLSDHFDNITVIVTSAFKDNPDPECIDGVPVDPKDKNSSVFCPIVIRRTITKEPDNTAAEKS
jgi:hypothetical protein